MSRPFPSLSAPSATVGPTIPSSWDLDGPQHTPERFRLLLENSLDLIVETSRQGEILYISPNMPAVFGYRVGDLLRLNVFAYVHPEDQAEMKALFARPVGRGVGRFRHKNGAWRWVETTSQEFASPEGELRRALVIRDITERREAEAARRHLEGELQKGANLSALGLMASGIAHDFNNMLTAIFGHLNIAQRANKNPDVRESLAYVEQAVGRARLLVREISNFNERQSDGHVPVCLQAAITEVLQFLRPTWPAKVEIVTELPPQDGWILANPIQIHQVLMNLFVNAIQAMKEGPARLEIRLRTVHVAQSFVEPYPDLSRGRFIQLTVSDTGHGMDRSTQRKIFEPFFTTKRADYGTGLGLAVVHNIVKNHGGSITVQSELGRGTTFQLLFGGHGSPDMEGPPAP